MNMEEYNQSGSLRGDYRQTDEDLVVSCDYDFLRHLNVGDVMMLINEETQNLNPWIFSVELSEFEDDELDNSLWRVTRKIYSATGLDVYVVKTDDNYDLD